MKLFSVLATLAFTMGAACAVAALPPEQADDEIDAGVADDGPPQLAADQQIVADLAALSDQSFFALVQYQAVSESTMPGALPWARSSYLATVDMIDGIRFSANHRGSLAIYLMGDRFVAEYQEHQWRQSISGWAVTAEREISGRVSSVGGGKILLNGLGIATRAIVRGQAAVVLLLETDLASRGAAGQTFIARRVLSSAAFVSK